MASLRHRVDVFLAPGELGVYTRPVNVKTILGSCVAVCLWDCTRHIGGINHFLLPAPPFEGADGARFGHWATQTLIARMCHQGARTSDLHASVVGGGHPLTPEPELAIGAENVVAALEELRARGIRVVRQEVGGDHGRKILFNTYSGCLIVRDLRRWSHTVTAGRY
ncbi:MAG: chemotaxis protein CheD [Planctomycetes bacterium]|nr:chemotaxis protein CheD [Planctomycetota bacterium]